VDLMAADLADVLWAAPLLADGLADLADFGM
jgi:hypothetical protein